MRSVSAACCLAAFACGCASPAQPAGDRVAVVVSILPMASFAERVGGEHVEVETLVPPGESPATYEPTPRQMARLAAARLYFCAGLPFEEAVTRKVEASFPDVEVVDTRQGIDLAPMAAEADGHAGHERGDEPHHHAPGELDPHVWLDPTLAAQQAKTMAEALGRIDPGQRADYGRNLEALRADLEAVDAEVRRALAPVKGRKLFVFHPAYGYFARRYGLEQVAVEIEGKEPGARQLARLIEEARAAGARVIFVQPQFSTATARSVARAIGGAVVPLDPLARDYVANLRRMASAVRDGLAAKEPPP